MKDGPIQSQTEEEKPTPTLSKTLEPASYARKRAMWPTIAGIIQEEVVAGAEVVAEAEAEVPRPRKTSQNRSIREIRKRAEGRVLSLMYVFTCIGVCENFGWWWFTRQSHEVGKTHEEEIW